MEYFYSSTPHRYLTVQSSSFLVNRKAFFRVPFPKNSPRCLRHNGDEVPENDSRRPLEEWGGLGFLSAPTKRLQVQAEKRRPSFSFIAAHALDFIRLK